MQPSTARTLPSSFRDPAGYVFSSGGEILRAVTTHGAADYEHLMSCGLGGSLLRDRLLLAHEELPAAVEHWPGIEHLLRPEQLVFVSYPYEWCFSQLKDAALLTLEIQERALASGMSLKDASAFNIQFHKGRPVLIDTLSFEIDTGGPWVAYEQFCRHFLAPLLLIEGISPEAGRLSAIDLGGIDLGFASRMLGWRSYLKAGALLHVHMHAKAIARRSADQAKPDQGRRGGAKQILDSLRRAVEGIRPPRLESEWSEYADQSSHYTAEALELKSLIVGQVLGSVPRGLVYDVGGNTGRYARIAAEAGHPCVLFDSDIECVERAYRRMKDSGETRILPLRLDVSNPTPALGVNLEERSSLFARPKADLVMALALIHHLRLRENIPFKHIAEFFASLGRALLLEWVGPEDQMARPMLMAKRSPPQDYNLEHLLNAFTTKYRLIERKPLAGMDRTLLVLECHDSIKP